MNSFSNLSKDKYGLKTIIHAIIGIAIWLFFVALYGTIRSKIIQGPVLKPLNIILVLVLIVSCILLFRYSLSLYSNKVLKKTVNFFLFGKVSFNLLWIVVSFLLPFVFFSFFLFFTDGNLIIADSIDCKQIFNNIAQKFLSKGLLPGVMEEMAFRGFTMKLIEKRWGKKVAILAPSLLFGIIHMTGGMQLTDIILLLIAGISVGTMFSMITYASHNIWNAAMIHVLWNTFIGDSLINISTKEASEALFHFNLESSNILLTGGKSGIQSSLPAITCYLMVALLAYLKMKKKQQEFTSNNQTTQQKNKKSF